MTIFKSDSCAWVISENIWGTIVTQTYIYYSKSQAIHMFRQHKKELLKLINKQYE